MAEVMIVGISDWRLAHSPDRLRSLGLGSCVGIVLYCRRIGLAAMAHVMLPDHHLAKSSFHPAKFADTAIPGLVDMLMQHGASLLELEAKMAGGAEMFPNARNHFPSIGIRNITTIRELLNRYKIPIVAEDTGGHAGRTIEFFTETAELLIKTARSGEKVI